MDHARSEPSASRGSNGSNHSAGPGGLRRMVVVLVVLAASGVAVAGSARTSWLLTAHTSLLLSDSIAVYGPAVFDIPEGGTSTRTEGFPVNTGPGLQFVLRVENGASGGANRVDSARVLLNGVVAFDPTDVNDTIPLAYRDVEPVGQDTLQVTLWGDSASFVRVTLSQQPDSEFVVFGPERYSAGLLGALHTDTFAVSAEDAPPHRLHLVNGNPAGSQRVLSAVVTLNDTIVVGLTEVGLGTPGLIKTVSLVEGDNVVQVLVVGLLGSFVDLHFTATDTLPPVIEIATPPPGFVTGETQVEVTGVVVDQTAAHVVVNDTAAMMSDGTFTATVPLPSEGANVLLIRATDAAGNQTDSSRTVIRDTQPPDLAVTEPLEDAVIETPTVHVKGTVTDATAVTLTVNGDTADVGVNGEFEHLTPLELGPNAIVVEATDEAGNTSTIIRNVTRVDDEEIPPDPSAVAPGLDPTVPATMHAATEFLYTGDDPIQTGVDPGTIDPVRVSVIRGRVVDRSGSPLPGVTITVHRHPDLGQTRSRADGRFDMAVNGGARLTVNYEKSGYLPVQRPVEAPWQNWAHVEDVMLIGLDSLVTAVSPDTATAVQVARGSVEEDEDGERQATLFFKPGTQVEMVLPGGSRIPLDTLSVRATEYTVGESGPLAMPGLLPATSMYTYAVELSVDQALAAGAVGVEFSQPVVFYLENFLEFPVGLPVPVGWWDREETAWMPAPDGRIVEIVAIDTAGLAALDVTGDSLADSDSTLLALGIDEAERETLAGTYAVGTSLWRVETLRFSPLDLNYPRVTDERELPEIEDPEEEEEDPCEDESSSVIECENQVLGESFPLTGTTYTLNYRSNRVPGHEARRTLHIPLTRDSLPSELQRVELRIEIAGRRIVETFAALPNQSYTFTWDGLDAYGRAVPGRHLATIRVGYAYPVYYAVPAPLARSFGLTCAGSDSEPGWEVCIMPTSVTSGARQEEVFWSERRATLGAGGGAAQGLGMWTLDVHHLFDPVDRSLYLGSGQRRRAPAFRDRIRNVAGTGEGDCGWWSETPDCEGDGGPAELADLVRPTGIAVGPDGSVFVAEWDGNRVRRIDPDGIISTVAGDGDFCNGFFAAYDPEPCGEDVPATEASLSFPAGLAVAPDGTLYIAEAFGFRIRRVDTDGIITTIAGQNVWCFGAAYPGCGDGGPASEAYLSNTPWMLALGPDGSLYLTDQNLDRVRRIGPDGIITTVAGVSDRSEWVGDGGPATNATVWTPMGIAVDASGAVYVTDWDEDAPGLRRITSDGVIRTIAGSGSSCFPTTDDCGDGGPATEAELAWADGVAVGPDGSVYLAQSGSDRVRRIGPDGIIQTVAGTGVFCTPPTDPCGDGGYAAAARLNWPMGLAVAPDGGLYIADAFSNRVRRLERVFPGFDNEVFGVASADGTERYQFDAVGRHLRTLDTRTGATLYSFEYDDQGLLSAVTDAAGLTTTIERDTLGIPLAIVAPFGQRVEVSLDEHGYLATVTSPADETIELTHTPDGLLTEVVDARGNASAYTYDELGMLIRAEDAAGGWKELARVGDGAAYEVSVTTSLGRTTTYRVERRPGGGQSRVVTGPDTLSTTSLTDLRGATSLAQPDGTVTTRTQGPDPRFGVQAPILSEFTVTTPSALTLSGSSSRVATLADPGDALSLVAQLDSVRINGRVSTSSYDAALRRFTNTTPAGRASQVSLDSLGRVVAEEVDGIAAVGYTYDAQGLLTEISQGPRTWVLAYDTLGRLASVTDPLARTDSLYYDGADRVIRQVLANGSEILYGYDANGNLTSLTPPGRPAHAFDFSAVNLDSVYTPPAAGAGSWATEYRYNLDRDLTEVIRPDAQVIALGYDGAGRVDTLSTPTGAYIYGYGATTGQITSVTAPAGGGTLSYAYDGFLPIETSWTGDVSGSVGVGYDANFWVTAQRVNGDSIGFSYDDDGLLTGAGVLAIGRSPENGLVTGSTLDSLETRLTYNAFGEVASDTARHGGTPLYWNTYARDDLGRITEKVEWIDGVTTTYTFTYDSIGRLVEVLHDSVAAETYTYDANGNRLSFAGPADTLAGSYDDQDRLLAYGSRTYTYTRNGELASKTTPEGTTTYTYDVLGNLRGVVLPDSTEIQYVIDGQNRRVGKRVDGVLVQGLLYQDQLNPIAELDSLGQMVSRFVYGSKPHVPDYVVRDGITYRIISDHLGSVRLVVDASTGDVAQRIDYDAYGRVTQDTNPGFQPFGFAGGLYDIHTGLVRFGARDYDAATGRWTVKDPIGFGGGDANLFAYAWNNPVSYIDPSGLRPLTECEKDLLRPYIPDVDLDNADLRIGEVPWYLPRNYSAITRRNVIYVRDGVYDASTAGGIALLGHELVHVGQYRQGANALSFLWSYRRGYRQSPFEIEAYDLQSRILRDLLEGGAPLCEC